MKYLERGDGRRLLLTIGSALGSGNDWIAAALEIPALVQSGAEALDNHAHKAIGQYETRRRAESAANSFGRAWQRDFRVARFEACGCDDMDTLAEDSAASAGAP